jgi:hypothetical protein
MNKSPCDECAFGKKGAGTEPYNSLRGQICALGAVPFFCHHSVDWESDQRFWVGKVLTEKTRQSGICQGWKARVRQLHAKGWFGEYREIRQAIAKHALRLIEAFTDEKDPETKKLYSKKLRKITRFLASRDIEHKEIPL